MRFLLKLAALLALLVAVGSWWLEKPGREAANFIGLLNRGELEQAAALLEPPSALEWGENGGVVVTSAAGAAESIEQGLLPFMAGEAAAPRVDRETTWADRLAARRRFAVAATGFGQDAPRVAPPVTLHLTTERGRVRIDAIHRGGATEDRSGTPR